MDTAQLKEYQEGREYDHSGYYHYTSLKNVNSILEKRILYVSSLSPSNDATEGKAFPHPELVYGLCFSTGINENLPLWYLYSGIEGQGGRIRLTKNGIKELISHAEYELQDCEDEGKKIPLAAGKNVQVQFGDVIYCGKKTEKGKTVDLKYNTMTNHIIPRTEEPALREEYKGFIKGLIWYYEKETRLLLTLINEGRNYIQLGHQYRILLHFDQNLIRKIQITLWPGNNRYQQCYSKLQSNSGFCCFFIKCIQEPICWRNKNGSLQGL